VSTKDFQVYRNRDKTSHTRDLLKEGEIQSTIVMEGPHSSTFSGSQFIVSTYSSKKQTYTTLLVDSSHEPTGSIIFYKYKLIKEKEKSVQMVVIPLEVVPLTGVRIAKANTTTEIPSSIPMQVPNSFEKLVKSMEDMSLQGEEIKKLQEEIKASKT
jgi:hypothetical protein